MKRGDVYLARLDPVEGSEQAGTRPVVIVTRDTINESLSTVTVVPLTSERGQYIYPSQFVVPGSEGGLTRDSVFLGEQCRTLSKARLLRQLGTLSVDSMTRAGLALREALDLDD